MPETVDVRVAVDAIPRNLALANRVFRIMERMIADIERQEEAAFNGETNAVDVDSALLSALAQSFAALTSVPRL
jgi:hypothetical protein